MKQQCQGSIIGEASNKTHPRKGALLVSVCRLHRLLPQHIKQHVNIPAYVDLVQIDANVVLKLQYH